MWFQQEYLCEFVDNGTEVFGRALVEGALDDALEPLSGLPMNTTFFVGLDLGKKHDPAAIAVVERVDRARAFQGSVFHQIGVRHVERVPLGTPYPRVVGAGAAARTIRGTARPVRAGGGCDGRGGAGSGSACATRASECELCAVTITAAGSISTTGEHQCGAFAEAGP